MTKAFHARLLLFSAVAALSAPATAQRIDRIVAFGDSYADDGNAFELGLVPAAALPLYPTRRFTGGVNYVDVLSEILDAPVANFAIGGARANPDFLFEVGSFSAGGGGPAFPTVTPTLDEFDLVTVSIGGNDARAYGSLPGASVAAAAAATAPAVAATAAGLDTLVAAGAQTISFLAGDTGLLPEPSNTPAVAPIRTAYSTAFNAGVQDVLAGYAANGVMVHYLDLTTLVGNIQADPAAYGITALNCPSFLNVPPDTTCLANAGQGFLFYGDLLHPTSQGSAIIARYIAAQLEAPLTLQGPSEVAVATGFQFGRVLRNQADAGRLAAEREGLEFFVLGDAFSRDLKPNFSTDTADINGGGGTVGVSYRFGSAVAGIAANYSRVRNNFSRETADSKTRSLQIGGFAGFAGPGLFANAYAGYGKDDHDLDRTGVVNHLEASPDGTHWLAGAKAGYLIGMNLPLLGAARLGPVAGVDYVRAKVDDYTEEGDAALALNVDSVTAKSMVGSLGGELRRTFGEGPGAFEAFTSAVFEKELSGNGHTVHFSQVTSPGIVNAWTFDDRSKKAYARFTTGGSVRISGKLGLDVMVTRTTRRKDGMDLAGHLGLRLGF